MIFKIKYQPNIITENNTDNQQISRKMKFLKLLEKLGENLKSVVLILLVIQLTLWTASFIFKFSTGFFFPFLLFFLVSVVFLLGKEKSSEKDMNFTLLGVKLSIVLLTTGAVNNFFINTSHQLSNQRTLLGVATLINLALCISLFALFRSENTKELIDDIKEESILVKLKILEDDCLLEQGDIKLATEVESGKPILMKSKDRFLHMLILGPTGSGKTSQVIMPMLNQDMKNKDCGITVIEPKADLAEEVDAMSEIYGRDCLYFNPILPDCPYFNPLLGDEKDIIENMSTTFKMLAPDSPQFFLDMNDTLLRNSLKVLKRIKGNDANLIDLYRLVTDSGGEGMNMVEQLSKVGGSAERIKENSDIVSYFRDDYFAERSKTYEHCSGIRSQVSKIIANEYLRKVLNPPPGEKGLDFEAHLRSNGVIAIATAQGKLGDLGSFLGYFLILQLQSAVFKREGDADSRRHHYLYIDEFQKYANPGFADMLTQGRSYRVASHLATQNRALIGMGRGQEGKDFIELVSTNARNVVIFPGGNITDAEYYSKQFGEVLETEVRKGVSQAKFNPIYGFQKISYPTESISSTEKLVPRFTPSDIIYQPFRKIIALTIEDNSIQFPRVGEISFIPQDLNKEIKRIVAEKNPLSEEDKRSLNSYDPSTLDHVGGSADETVSREDLLGIDKNSKDTHRDSILEADEDIAILEEDYEYSGLQDDIDEDEFEDDDA